MSYMCIFIYDNIVNIEYIFQYRSWREGLIIFGELGAAVANGQVILLNDTEASNVHAHLRDLASITQALTRLYSLFIGNYCE